MFRTTHIRTKLALALAVPLLSLMAVAGYQVVDATKAVDDAGAQTSLAATAIGPGSLLSALQDERNRAAIDLIGLGDAVKLQADTNDQARAAVDAAVSSLRARVRAGGAEVAQAFGPAFDGLDALEQLRADIDANDRPMDLDNNVFADAVFGRYTTIIEGFFDATSTIALSLDDADLRNGVDIIDAASRQSEMRARIVRTAVLAAVTETLDDPAVREEVAALHDRSLGFDEDIARGATGAYQGIASPTFAEPNVQAFNTLVETFLGAGTLDVGAMLKAVDSSDPSVGYQGLRARATDTLADVANGLQNDAVERQRLFGGIALAGLLVAVALTWLASRSITRPLKSLMAQAETMAGTTLPAAVRQILDTPAGEDVSIPAVVPIEVKSRDEVAGVAKALSSVQTSALDLAVEQAVLRRNISDSYVNLGRRNQNLLSRQLDLITDLERNESDPDALEGLFRLDHLATRMRRNAESLLVLAGIEPPRQWAAPVKISDLVRAALGEVEDYQRVVVRHLEPAAVTGAVAADVAHVLAELVENALSFSPPEQSVEVKGRLTTTGYTVAITDNGLGMGPEDIARANRRLAGHESFTVAPSRYLGHYVAGHLASRLGVVVELQASPAGGITARVDIPMGLLANEETDPRLVALRHQDAAPEEEAAPAPAPAAPAIDLDLSTPPAPVEPVADVVAPAPTFTDGGLPRRVEQPAEPAAPAAPVSAGTFGDLAPRGIEDVPPPPPPPVVQPTARAERSTGPAHFRRETSAPAAPTPRPVPAPAPAPVADAPWPAPEPAPEAPVPDGPWPAPASVQPILSRRAAAEPASTPTMDRLPGDATSLRPADPAPAASGLTRRVPGAQRPDVPLGGVSEARDDASTRTTPEDVYAFLSNFQSGVARGRAEAHHDDRAMEDDR